jgi:hypothetical protein
MKLLILFLVSLNAHSYVPTVEALFRNGNNAEIKSNTIVGNFTVKKISGETTPPPVQEGQELQTRDFTEGHVKLLFSKDDKEKIKLLQLYYTSPDMKLDQISEIKSFPTFKTFPKVRGLEATEQGLFYSIINTLILNDGYMMVDYLRSKGVSVRFNKEIINNDKVGLLGKYKEYLTVVKRDKDLKETLPSPLSPPDEDELSKVRGILKSPFFKESPIIKRIRQKNAFYWKVETDNFTALFSNEKRNLEQVDIQTTWGTITVYCKDYMLFNGVHEFPKYIYYKDLKGDFYQVQLLSLKHFEDTPQKYNNRLETYMRSLEKNKEAGELFVVKPSFIL